MYHQGIKNEYLSRQIVIFKFQVFSKAEIFSKLSTLIALQDILLYCAILNLIA